MCYELDSTKRIKPTLSAQTESTPDVVTEDTTSLQVFQKTLPQSEEMKERLANLDVKNLVKQYKDNPIAVLNILGINFTEEETEELKEILKGKKELKAFLNLVKENQALKPGDILGAMRNIKKYAPTKVWYKKIGNVIKKAFTDGFDDAFKLAQSETLYYADKLGENMNEVRTERQDFSSETVVDVSDTMTQQPETKENVMHFVTKSNNDGSKLYTEQDVINARNIIVENIDDADEFTANAAELEAIQDSKGNIKYQGSTIVNVGEKMIKHKEVKSTMLTVAKKSDMTDKYLMDTTSSLAANHAMAESIEFLATAKDDKGADRFSAHQVSEESKYLESESQNFCNRYCENAKTYSQYKTIESKNVLELVHGSTEKPETKQATINQLNKIMQSGKTKEEINQNVQRLVEKIKKGEIKPESTNSRTNETKEYVLKSNKSDNNENSASSSQNASNEEVISNARNTYSNPITNGRTQNNRFLQSRTVADQNDANLEQENQYFEATVINGVTYERKEILRKLTKKYGSTAEKVLNAIEKDPSFIDLMKQYNGNNVIINALVEDPYLITKIKRAAGSLSVNEIADIVKLCTDATSTKIMLNALENYSPAEAMKITKQSKILNLKDDALSILTSTNSSQTGKRTQLENLYNNSGKKQTEIIG